MTNHSLPPKEGLYDPANEHDACGVGFIANIKGKQSHDIVEQALEILANLTHRGACGCDPETGDGSGILTQIPHKFYARELAVHGIELPEPGRYGVGMVFLPPDRKERESLKEIVDATIERHGRRVLGWRDVPVNSEALGFLGAETEPYSELVFIGGFGPEDDFNQIERDLYVIRRASGRETRESKLLERDYFYWASLSSRTVIYKGLMLAERCGAYYPELHDPDFESAIVLVHQRYSTNTFPSWELSQPFRFLAHNGEINTLRGNVSWMGARQYQFQSELYGADIQKLLPIIPEGISDSAAFDNALELLVRTGRSIERSAMMLIPEAWENHRTMSQEKKDFYEYHASLMEPWDGPASIGFTDGSVIGALLDRNGLRPSRYWVTKDDRVIMASEAGVLQVPPEEVVSKGRLKPGRMFLVDTVEGRIIPDDEIKTKAARSQPYGEWLKENLVRLDDLSESAGVPAPFETDEYETLLRTFGYTEEDIKMIVTPMSVDGKEPTGSMGNDTPLAVLSDRPQLLYNYFKQLFAQVTNPPLDGMREELITALRSTLGSEQDLFTETPEHCRMLALDQPVLTNEDLAQVKALDRPGLKTHTLKIHFPSNSGEKGLRDAMEAMFDAADAALKDGATILVLSDRGVDADDVPIPAALACAGLHHHLIRQGTRNKCGIIVESAEVREVHHYAVLLGYGACAINPYLTFQLIDDLVQRDQLRVEIDTEEAISNYIKAVGKGLIKVMSKMGISTVASYRGAQIFECVGLKSNVVHRYFTWTASRIEGIGLNVIAAEAQARHAEGFPEREVAGDLRLDVGGVYHWRRGGEKHFYNPETVAPLQRAVRKATPEDGRHTFSEYTKTINEYNKSQMALRSLLEFIPADQPVSLEDVEPASEIVKRFASGAMSFGSISAEAHETLAIAMNRIGGKSNTGEGGEDPRRFTPDPETGDSRCSAIKQVASGRFGVTSQYLVKSEEIQIKMAQGAKPGEGGQLPGHKVSEWIAKTRHSTPGVGLISPPPHHDIYSIEDLAQLIHDLKNANRDARINVKLVSEVGVGTVAAGVSKGKADVVLIAGDSGGTGASPQTSIKHAGLPWELGLAESHQVLVKNGLRSRIVLQTDGQIKTGRDVAIAALLGAEEWGMATAPLIALGCIMMRKCHLNTCPVGIATQDEELRKKFAGKPEYVVNFFFMVAEELREIMATLGFKTVNEMVGRVDRLKMSENITHWKASGIDLSGLLKPARGPAEQTQYCSEQQDHGLEKSLDVRTLLKICKPALEEGKPIKEVVPILNIHRTVGTITGSQLTRKWGADGLPDGTIDLTFEGTAGQSFGAFVPRGMKMSIIGDANDYFGKGLSGGTLTVKPSPKATFKPEENIIIGNVAFYGATSGHAFINGMAGERFCVRNSGAETVVEGVGDHGCEYMTGGKAVILGSTGRNFAAGMSGGIAYVLDEEGDFAENRCNTEMVGLERLKNPAEIAQLKAMIQKHQDLTQSPLAKRVLGDWDVCVEKFVKVMPHDYKRVLLQWAKEKSSQERVKLAEVLAGA